MSERSKGDTSTVAAPQASVRIVKNTLLSASVTGLTFDDFQNKPLLLPAAPPIIQPVPVVTSRESTPLVTVGKSSDIDSENLSEVNLNEFAGTSTSSTADISDENSNSLLDPSTQADNSILSQAASSFSQLPSVASSVFSTFSKKFNSSSEREGINTNSSPQLNIQPFSNPTSAHIQLPPLSGTNQDHQQSAPPPSEPQPPINPPTFYSPTEVAAVPSGVPCPPIAAGQNTYRISARKKVYAPIPGLSAAHQEQNFSAVTASFLPPIGFEASPVPVYQEQSLNKPEERKGGRFSLSSLVPGVPSVLQNLSGLVQSAAGSLSQKSEESLPQQPINNLQVSTAPSAFYSTADPNTQQAQVYQPSVNFFAPPVADSTLLPAQPIPGHLFEGEVPLQGQEQPIGNFFTAIPPRSGLLPTSTAQPLSGEITRTSEPKPVPETFAPQSFPVFRTPGEPPQLPPSTGILFAGLPPKSTTPDITPGLATPPPQQLPAIPLSAKPPSGGPHSASFRLQKGTRLYKSPFASTPAEYQQQPVTAYLPAPQNIIPTSETTAQIANLFNPLQQAFLPPQVSFSPSITGGEAVSATIFAPSATTEGTGSFNNQPLTVPLQTSSEQQAHSSGDQPPKEPPKVLSVGVSKTDVPEQTEIVNPAQEQQNLAQSISLPPPPAPTLSTATSSKETANFPPPPPQNLFQNKLNLNPYRKGLQAHHSQLTASVPESTIFTPSQQDDNLFKPAATEAGNLLPQVLPAHLPPAPTPNPTIFTRSQQDANLFKFESSNLVPQVSPSAPPSEPTIFTPSQQDISLIKPEAGILLPQIPPSIAAQFAPAPASISTPRDQDANIFKPENGGLLPQIPPSIAAQFAPAPSTICTPKEQDANIFKPETGGLLPQIPPPITAQFPPDPSTICTPKEQAGNLFNPIVTEAAVPQGPPSIAAFFTNNPKADCVSNQPETEVLAAEIPINSFANQPANLTSGTFSSIVAPLGFLDESVVSEPPTATPLPTLSTPVTSFFTATTQIVTTLPLKKELEKDRETPTSTTNLVSFFTANVPPLDPFSTGNTKEQLIRSEPQDKPKKDQSVASVPAASAKIASPPKSQEKSESQQSVPNLFTSFFEQSAPTAETPIVKQTSLPDPTSFFDSFSQVPSVGVNAPPPEDPNSQRIQNFFNNPPPKDFDPVGDLNYNLVGSGLCVKNLQTRSLTPASNLAEPPSSSCSEFSELNSSLSAVNRQPRLPAEDSTKVSPEEESIFEAPDNLDLPEEILNEIKMSSVLQNSDAASVANVVYKPAVKHWFYKRKLDTKHIWKPFSFYDSATLEEAFLLGDAGPNLVAVEGGRYDVNISERTKAPVYWEGEPIEVQRCSWFFKASDSKYVPYAEEIADLLEEEYRKASENCEWHKKIPISGGDMVVFHGPTVIVHFQQQLQVDSWGGSTLDSESFLSSIQQQTKTRPRVVKRDLDDFIIDEGESHKVDHILFMVHGIGSACDLKMRTVEEVVDEFRAIALQLVQSHYKNSVENGFVGRVEVLPISWHSELHSEELGIDEKLKSITLESIPKLRNFTNDTLLDILFYTSPMFCQRIMNTVTASMNSVFIKYKERNPDFHGRVSLAGHSLGSLILFDLLCHQRPPKECEEQNMENPDEMTPGNPVDSNQLDESAASHISYKMGPAGTGQPFISYPQLLFQPKTFFALGSPIGMFVTIRGIDKLGLDFRLPTCSGFYNIFHPYDPVAYRLEALVNPDMNGISPVLIPHHKGRKRMHLELKETMTRVGADLKQRFFETFKTTFDSVRFLAPKQKDDSKDIEQEVNKLLELQAQQETQSQQDPSKKYNPKEIENEIKRVLEVQTQQTKQGASTSRSRADSNSTNHSDNDIIEIDLPLGKLNNSKRIDYILQEAPLEFFNEYLFALSSHVCYWESEDTILFVMKEIYNGVGYSPDSQVPQQTMTIERPSSSGSTTQSPTR